MNTEVNKPNDLPCEIEDQLALYFDNQATPEVNKAIQDWLAESPANAATFAEYGSIERMVYCAQKTEDASAVFALLAEMENNAEADIVTLLDELPATQSTRAKLSAHDLAAAGRYLFEHAMANKRAVYTAYSAIAAALLLTLTLFFIFSGSPDEPVVDPLAHASPWHTPASAHQPVVATLTDSVGAQWRSDDKPVPMPMGAQLVAYERFTLTRGFAQITTQRGAKILLQAPSTIELTGSDNAIRLHRGKLVGRCDTADSKGFVVHAPGMDVVDLGTEFGVQADAARGSTVLVMQGEVRAQPTAVSPRAFQPVVLTESQVRRVVPETGGLEMIAISEAPAFYKETPHPYVAAVLDAQPVAYWRFEDDSAGIVRNDVDSALNSLGIVGSATLSDAGVIGRAGQLTNREAPVSFFETPKPIDALDGSEEFTAELWYYTNERYDAVNKNGTATLIALFNDERHLVAPAQRDLLLIELMNDYWVDKKGAAKPIGWEPYSIRIYPPFVKNGALKRELFSPEPYVVAQWQHLVIVNRKGTLELYLDGQLSVKVPSSLVTPGRAKVRLGSSLFKIAKTGGAGSYWESGQARNLRGRLDEVALYDRPLSAEEIAKHHALATEQSP